MPDDLDAVIGEAVDEMLKQREPVPAAVRTYARAVFGLRSVDAELADLVDDMSVDQRVGTRAEAERFAVFRSGGSTIELREDFGSRDVVGRVDPATPGEFLVRTSQECQGGDVTPGGTFRFKRPAAEFALRLVLGDRVIDMDPIAW